MQQQVIDSITAQTKGMHKCVQEDTPKGKACKHTVAVYLHGIGLAFVELHESFFNFLTPEDLVDHQNNLTGPIKDPLFTSL
jgi:hypothetical protein